MLVSGLFSCISCFCLLIQLVKFEGINTQEECPRMCTCKAKTVECDGVIPVSLPQYAENVTIYNAALGNESTSVFGHETWSSVQSLILLPDIDQDGNIGSDKSLFDLREHLFVNLKSLKSLRITSRRLRRLERDAFAGLSSLEVLDLSDNVALTFENMMSGLQSNNLYSLRSLTLRGLSTLTPEILHFDASFFKALEHTHLEVLDLSYTSESILHQPSFAQKLPYLSEINFERAGYLATYFLAATRTFPNGASFKNLKKLNLNYGVLPAGLSNPNFDDVFGSPLAQNLTELRARAYVSPEYTVRVNGLVGNQTVTIKMEFKQITLTWKLFALMLNKNGTEIALEILDISENAVEHIGRSLTRYGKNLRHINLSHNRLSAMDKNDFEELLYNATALEEFFCSHNQLKVVPDSFFSFTVAVKIIDFSHNKLETVSFKIEHLHRLHLLNLSNNNIQHLDELSVARIDTFVKSVQGRNNSLIDTKEISNERSISIDGNPLKCSCDDKVFVRWMVSAQKRNIFVEKDLIKCKLDNGNMREFEDEVIDEMDYLCSIPIIVAVSAVVSAIVLIIIIVIIIGVYLRTKRISRRKHLLKFITKYKADSTKPKVPVFLSYCSADSEFVSQKIIPTLNTKLQQLFETNEICVSTGDLNFSPGFYVAEEIIKCVESCSVVIACVSKQFCKSHWCKDELLTAKCDDKPIILMFLDHVEIQQMPKVLQKQFQLTTRCKWSLNEKGDYSLTPNWDTFCKAVLELMQTETKFKKETCSEMI